MVKRILFVGAATLGLAVAMAPASAIAGKPQYGSWGIDTTNIDKDKNPGDSFFDYANGNWVKKTEIPADRSNWGSNAILADLADQRIRTILEEAAAAKAAPGSIEQKLGDFYASFMDEAAIEAKGISPLQPYLDKIAAIQTGGDLARFLGEASRLDIRNPIDTSVGQDLKNNDAYAVYVGQGGLGLPDRDYYLDETNPKFAETREKYKQHIATMLRLAGISDPEIRAQRIYALERKIAEKHWTRVEQRQTEKTYNPMSKADLAKNMPGFDWQTYLDASGIGAQNRFIITHPSAIAGAAALTQSEDIESWKDYLTFAMIAKAAPLLSRAFVEENFAFNGKVLNGTPQLKDRWKRGVDLVSGNFNNGGAMGEAIGQIYVARYFPPETKAKADILVKNLVAAMDRHLAALEWMSPETKVKARAKLAAFTAKIGHPDKWRDFSALNILPGDALGDALRVEMFKYQRNLDKLGKPVDRSEWEMFPQTANAYANPPMNEIVFPAGYLQPPFFDPDADDAVNYGAIGVVIGHEISHHFDDQGSLYDPTGNLNTWWNEADIAKFKALTDQVVKQYGEYEPLPGVKVNGELTLGENIADLAGMAIAYDAYKMSLKGKPAPVLDGYTGDQRFFLGYAQMRRIKYRDATLQLILTTDPHTPGNYRPNVMRNFDVWYKAFNIKSGKLYLPPEKRIKIW